jgi:hypothetical protein
MASPKQGSLSQGDAPCGSSDEERAPETRLYPTEEEHDGSLIRWMLDLTPEERLSSLQGFADLVHEAHRGRSAKLP